VDQRSFSGQSMSRSERKRIQVECIWLSLRLALVPSSQRHHPRKLSASLCRESLFLITSTTYPSRPMHVLWQIEFAASVVRDMPEIRILET
jgi:hypothetical protein